MADPRVVITEIGVISPVGLDVPTGWDTLCAGLPCIAPISLFHTETFPGRIAGAAYGRDPRRVMSTREARRCDRTNRPPLAAPELVLSAVVGYAATSGWRGSAPVCDWHGRAASTLTPPAAMAVPLPGVAGVAGSAGIRITPGE